MDAIVPEAPGETPAAVQGVNLTQTLQFLRDNFAVVSAVSIAAGIALATLFLFSYLSAFDWHLVWLVQYQDVLSFGLIAVAILGSSVVALNSYFYMGVNAKSPGRRWMVAMAIVVILLIAWSIWSSIINKEGYFHVLSESVLACGFVFLLYGLVWHLRSNKWPGSVQAISLIILVVILTAQGGRLLAEWVLETNQFVENVQIKNQTLKDVNLVIVMSRFSVFLKDNVLHVYPTADIAELQTDHKLTLIP